jgi:hypothetical protein
VTAWEDYVETGVGGDGIALRFVVDGCEFEFCESEEMCGAVQGDSLLDDVVTWSASPGIVATGQADPLGGTDAALLTDDDAGNYENASVDTAGYVSGEPIAVEFWIKKALAPVTHFSAVNVNYDGTPTLQVQFRHDISATSVTVGTATDVEMVEAVTGWWRLRFKHAGAAAATVTIVVYPASGLIASGFPSGAIAATGAITVYGASITIPDGRTRVNGLMREGAGFAENAYIAGAELSASINAVRIMETPYPHLDSASSVFAAIPDTRCYLASTLSASATSMTVDSDDDLSVGDFLHVSTEVLKVAALPGADVVTIVREQWRTTAQRHTVTTSAGAPATRALRTSPRVWAGRRCWMYAHGASEFGVGDEGHLLWRGTIASEPQLDADGIMWSLPIGSRWSLLDQEIGTDLDKPRALRGIYYPGVAPFTVSYFVSSDETRAGLTSALTPTVVRIVGYYETQETFCEALVAALNASSASFEFGWQDTNGQWDLLVTVPTPARYLLMSGGSHVDGWFNGSLVANSGDEVDYAGRGPVLGTAADGTTYFIGWSDAPALGGFLGTDPAAIEIGQLRRVPRSINSPTDWTRDSAANVALHPSSRCYLDSVVGLAAGSMLIVSEGDGEPRPPIEVTSVDTATGSVDASASFGLVATGSFAPSIIASNSYSDADGTTLAGFRDALIAAAPDGANDASTPWVTTDDLADWTAKVDTAANGRGFLEHRGYVFRQGVRTSDVIKHECRAYGLFPYHDADFKVALRPVTIDTAAVPSSRWLDADDGTLLTGNSFGEIRSGEDGNVNVVEWKRGYDPVEDKHTGASITVVTVEGISEAKKRRVLEIAPKVAPISNDVDVDTAYRLSDPIRALFGGQILHYVFSVPISFWGVLIGDSVRITSPQIPYKGKRAIHDPGQGFTSKQALVVGREWDIENGTGKLTVLVTGLRVAGYTPSARVASQSGATTTWVLTVDTARYAPSGGTDASYFVVGDEIRLIEWDAAVPTVLTGNVTAQSGDTISVLLDGTWTPGAATWVLSYGPSHLVVGDQSDYCFFASSARRIDDGGTGVPARVFAP